MSEFKEKSCNLFHAFPLNQKRKGGQCSPWGQSCCNYLFDSDLLISQRSCWTGGGQAKTTVCPLFLLPGGKETSWPHWSCLVAELVILPTGVWLLHFFLFFWSRLSTEDKHFRSWQLRAVYAPLLQPAIHFFKASSPHPRHAEASKTPRGCKGEPPSPSLSLWLSNELLDLWHLALSARTKSGLSQRGEPADGSTEAGWGGSR